MFNIYYEMNKLEGLTPNMRENGVKVDVRRSRKGLEGRKFGRERGPRRDGEVKKR